MDILTDEQLIELRKAAKSPADQQWGDTLAFGRAVIAEVLTKLGSAEPVWWAGVNGEQPVDAAAKARSGEALEHYSVPLYTHPAPSEGDRRDAVDATAEATLNAVAESIFNDAERFRWACEHPRVTASLFLAGSAESVRAAIDAARTPSEKGGR